MWWRGSAAAARGGRARCQSDCASLWCGAWYFNPGRRAHPGLLLVAHLGAERRGGGAAGRRRRAGIGCRGGGGGGGGGGACLNLLLGVLLGGERLAARLERALEEQLRAAELALLDVRARQVVQQLELRAVVACSPPARRTRAPRPSAPRSRAPRACSRSTRRCRPPRPPPPGRARPRARTRRAGSGSAPRAARSARRRAPPGRAARAPPAAVELVQAVRVLELAPRRELAVRLHRLHRLRVPAQLDQRDQLAVTIAMVRRRQNALADLERLLVRLGLDEVVELGEEGLWVLGHDCRCARKICVGESHESHSHAAAAKKSWRARARELRLRQIGRSMSAEASAEETAETSANATAVDLEDTLDQEGEEEAIHRGRHG